MKIKLHYSFLIFLMSSAHASNSFVVDFSLCDSSLGGKVFDCHVTPQEKEVLSYDNSSGKWKPLPARGLNYKGLWNATGAAPTATSAGDYFIVSVSGNGYLVGDWTIYKGSGIFEQIHNSSLVTDVFNRTGAFIGKKNDYDLAKLSDVETVTPQADDVLMFDGALWTPGVLSNGNVGSVKSVTATTPLSVASSTLNPVISISKSSSSTNGYLSASDWTVFNGKQNGIAATSSADYLRGDKTFQALTTTIVPEGTKLYFTTDKVLSTALSLVNTSLSGAISSTDTVLQAFGKTQQQLSIQSGSGGNYLIRNSADTISGTVSLTGVMTASGSGNIIVRDPPFVGNSVVSKNYVDGKLDKTTDGAVAGVVTLNNDLKIKGGVNYVTVKGHASSAAYSLLLPANTGTNNYVLSTDGNGNTSWVAQVSVNSTDSVTATSIIDGSIMNADISASASIEYSKVNVPALAIPLAKLNATGTKDATTYLKGNDTWSNFNSAIEATVLSTYALGTSAVVSAADSVKGAFGKLQTQVSNFGISAVGGDFTGSLPTLTVAKIRSVSVSATPPVSGDFLKYNGTNWQGAIATVTELGNLFPANGCSNNQILRYSTDTLAFVCTGIDTLDATKFTSGDIAAARLSAAFLNNVGQIHSATSKTLPTNADEIPLADSASSFTLKKITWANFVIALKSFFTQKVIGEIRVLVGTTPPSGWMLCQGQILNIASYPATYAILGNTYGGDGVTTFALPDLRGRIPLGVSGSHAIGSTGGAVNATLSTANIPSHAHTATFTAVGGTYSPPTIKLKISNDSADLTNAAEGGYLGVGASDGSAQPYMYRSDLGSAGFVHLSGLTYTPGGGFLTGGSVSLNNSGNATPTAVSTMSPYMSVNYIMYLGDG